MCFIVVCSTVKMVFLAKAKKRAAAHTDCEIIEVEPLSFKVPEKVDKGKAVTTMPKKRKGNLHPGPREKLMKDVISARAGSEGPEGLPDPSGGAEVGERFKPAWRLGRDTNVGTVAER